METRLTELEIKVAYQENLIEELNKVLTSQQTDLVRMAQELKQLNEAIQSGAGTAKDAADDTPPPHY